MVQHELTIQETQSISLEILHTIAEICEKQHLRYSLIYGTLIGAIRHHGFSLWNQFYGLIQMECQLMGLFGI